MKMIFRIPLVILVLAVFTTSLHGQSNSRATPFKFRAVLHDPMNPSAELFYADDKGEIVELKLRRKALSETFTTLPVNGSLVLYDTKSVDPEKPEENLAASVKIPKGVKQAMILLLPGREDQQRPYRMLVIDDSEKAFPGGESRVIPLIGLNIGVEAGEHKVGVKPGEITKIPPVRKVSDYNMAQTNFYYQRDDAWITITERQLKYLDACRRLFIVDATPGAIAPRVSTIMDVSR